MKTDNNTAIQITVTFYKNLFIEKIFIDFDEAIRASNKAYGLDAYAQSEIVSRRKLLSNVKKFYLDTDGNIWYVTDFINRKTGGKYSILHKFSWISCIHNGSAAIVKLYEFDNEIPPLFKFSDNRYDRESLRGQGIMWTLESI